MRTLAEILLVYIGLYPVVTAAAWMAGGLLFRLLDEGNDAEPPEGGWPGVSVLIPAYNEEPVIETSVRSVLASEYRDLEVIVLDDGSTDGTAAAANAAGEGDSRLDVVRDPRNRGKAARLNLGFERARNPFVVVTDADTNVHPLAVKLMVARVTGSPVIAAVAAGPFVTNRETALGALQSLEAASIIGLIRSTQALAGRVGTVAGVLGLYRREAVLAVGGFDGRMATEDIDLSWRLLLAGWQTTYEPEALVGMEVPTTLRGLWAQRCRWARGQGEVLQTHLRSLMRWRHRRLWPIAFESVGSLIWVILVLLAGTLTIVTLLTGPQLPLAELGFAWAVAIAVVATLQLAFALAVRRRYDPRGAFFFLLGPLFPIAYWLISAAAAVRSEVVALVRGPGGDHISWDQPREQLEPTASTDE